MSQKMMQMEEKFLAYKLYLKKVL